MSRTPKHIRQLLLLDKIRIAGDELETLLQELDSPIPPGATEALAQELADLSETVSVSWEHVVNNMPKGES